MTFPIRKSHPLKCAFAAFGLFCGSALAQERPTVAPPQQASSQQVTANSQSVTKQVPASSLNPFANSFNDAYDSLGPATSNVTRPVQSASPAIAPSGSWPNKKLNHPFNSEFSQGYQGLQSGQQRTIPTVSQASAAGRVPTPALRSAANISASAPAGSAEFPQPIGAFQPTIGTPPSVPHTTINHGAAFPPMPTDPSNVPPRPAIESPSLSSASGNDFRGFANTQSSTSWNANLDSDPVWWRPQVHQPMQSHQSPQGVDSNSLVYQTLKRSPKIQALSQNPLIRDLQIVEADSDFDPVSFLQTQYQDRVDPVGDTLSITNDGSAFLEDHIWTANAGVRKKARNGASYELSQQLGFKNSNANFFTPQDQGTATLALNLTQPLLRGRGKYINQSQILIAQSALGGAWSTFAGELQDEIQNTVNAYWRLYYDRCVYLQKKRNVERGSAILRTLEGRAGLDSLPSQIARARSAVLSRKTDLANALRDIRDSETELRRLTADRNWKANQSIELVPTEAPIPDTAKLGLENVVYTALEHRPEIKEVIQRSKIAGVQQDISQNDILPELSLLLGTYVSALEGDSNLGQAIQNQFGEVKPGFSVGLEFELPIRNRAARSRLSQRKLQVAKIKAEVDEVMQNVVAESQVSLRRVESSKETMVAAFEAIKASRFDLEQNFRRWESFALIEGDLADGQTPTTILDQLLDSQERLTAAELVYSQSELELKSAEVGLLRTMGTLLIHRNVNMLKTYQDDMPQINIDQTPNLSTNGSGFVGNGIQH